MPGETYTIKKELPLLDNIKKVNIRKDENDGKIKIKKMVILYVSL